MYELRKLYADDIIEIKDNLVESRDSSLLMTILTCLVPAPLSCIHFPEPAYAYLKDNKVVACCGAVKIDGFWDVWILMSKNFSCFTRARAIMAFKSKLNEIGGLARIGIPSDLPNGRKYAEFLGGKFIRSETSRLFAGVTNDIYEVA